MATSRSDGNQASLRIGTRGSPLALAQADETRARLVAAHPQLAGQVEIVVIKTTGDKVQDRPLSEIGGKGLFTKEIEDALLAGEIDVAVHSMKDVPTWLPDGLVIDCLLPREDPRDVLISTAGTSIATLPQGAVVGSASLRRAAQVKALRPDLTIVPLRGNVETRAGDDRVNALLAPLNDRNTQLRVAAERACLAVLDGSCRTPIAAFAELEGEVMRLRALIALPDGAQVHRQEGKAPAADAGRLGEDIGRKLKELAGPDFLA